jgi:hypothetical protein
MSAIEAIAFAGSAGFAVVLVCTTLAIIGIGHEERLHTFKRKRPPTVPSLLARRIVGLYVRRTLEVQDKSGDSHKCHDANSHALPRG